MAGHEDNGQDYAFALKGLLHFEAVHSGHPYVKQDAAIFRVLRGLQEGVARFISAYLESHGLEHEADAAADCDIIVDQVDDLLTRSAHFWPRALGNVNRKMVPRSGPFSNQMRPPWASMIVRQIESPIPIPDVFDVTNGWNNWAATSSLIPDPLSWMLTVKNPVGPGALEIASERVGLPTIASIALRMRLNSTC